MFYLNKPDKRLRSSKYMLSPEREAHSCLAIYSAWLPDREWTPQMRKVWERRNQLHAAVWECRNQLRAAVLGTSNRQPVWLTKALPLHLCTVEPSACWPRLRCCSFRLLLHAWSPGPRAGRTSMSVEGGTEMQSPIPQLMNSESHLQFHRIPDDSFARGV